MKYFAAWAKLFWYTIRWENIAANQYSKCITLLEIQRQKAFILDISLLTSRQKNDFLRSLINISVVKLLLECIK